MQRLVGEMETRPAKRRSEAARRSKEVPQDLTQDVGTILQSTVLEHSTASPLMILLLAGASYVCWTQPGTLQQLRGSTGCGSFVERITRREVVSPRIEGSEHAPDPANSPVCVLGHAGEPYIISGPLARLIGTSRFHRAFFPPRCLVWLSMLVWLVCVFFAPK